MIAYFSPVRQRDEACCAIDTSNRPGEMRRPPCRAEQFSVTFLISPKILPILLLIASNVFMTFAWYGHLKYKMSPLYVAVLSSWSIAFIEYWLAVPANRIGHQVYTAAELKTMQEVITLCVFAVFSVLYLREALSWNHALGFMLIAGGAALIFRG